MTMNWTVAKTLNLVIAVATMFCTVALAELEEKDFTPEFVTQCKRKAKAGDAEGQALYGCALLNGWGVQSNHVAAVEWFRKAAGQGNALGQFNLGNCYLQGRGGEKNGEKAVEWLEKAAKQGNVKASYVLWLCYDNGLGVKRNEDLGRTHLYNAASGGYADAQYAMGVHFSLSKFDEDKAQAAEWFKKAAEQGHAEAQFELGFCYFTGNGREKNEVMALKWFQRAAEQGSASAQFELGKYLAENLEDDDQSIKEAARWYLLAAKQGHEEAQCKLGFCYYEGKGVKLDLKEAAKWWMKSAEQGYVRAQYCIGNCYFKGEGVGKDIDKALYWYGKNNNDVVRDDIYFSQVVGIGIELEIRDSFILQTIYRDFKTTDNARKQLFKPSDQYDNEVLGGAIVSWPDSNYLEDSPTTWECANGDKYSGKWRTCDKSGKIIRIYNAADNESCNLYVGALCEQNRAFVERKIASFTSDSRYFWQDGFFVTKDNLNGIEKAVELIKEKSPVGRQHVKIVQITGGNTALAYNERLNQYGGFEPRQLIHLICTDIGKLHAEDEEIEFDKLFWASTYTYETRDGNTRTILQLATDLNMAVRTVRVSLGLYDVTDPVLGKIAPRTVSLNIASQPLEEPKVNPKVNTTFWGSGFFITPSGHFLTNFHIVEKAKKYEILWGDKKYAASLVDSDPNLDVALLRVKGQRFPSLPFSGRRIANLGEDVFAVGYPRPTLQGASIKVTKGVISSLRGIMDDPHCYQIDASLQPGNSGGPIVDAVGNVVGVSVSQLKGTKAMRESGDIPQNVNYAIKSSFVMAFLDSTQECAYKTDNRAVKPQAPSSGISENVPKACGLVIAYE